MLKSELFCLLIATAIMAMTSSSAQASDAFPPLTDGQKAIALATFQSTTLATAAANSLNAKMSLGAPDSSAVTQQWQAMNQILKASTSAGQCTAQNSQALDPISGSVMDESFTLNGPDCQVDYSEDEQNPNDDTTSYSNVQLAVIDDTYRAMTDVDSLMISGSSTSVPTGDNSHFSVTFLGTGSLHSQKLGILSLTITGSGNFDVLASGSFETDFHVNFPDFVAVLHQATTIQQNIAITDYSLNGITLTEDEVNTAISPASLPSSPQAKIHFMGLNLR
jgi:hypothetical protein